jgi:hypothetical protein
MRCLRHALTQMSQALGGFFSHFSLFIKNRFYRRLPYHQSTGRAQTTDHSSFGRRCKFVFLTHQLTNGFIRTRTPDDDDSERIYLGYYFYFYSNNNLLTVLLLDDDDDDKTVSLPSSEYRKVDGRRRELEIRKCVICVY